MNEGRFGLIDRPLVPDHGRVDSAPEADGQVVAGLELHGIPDRKVEGEPAEHPVRVIVREDRHVVFAVESRVEISSEPVQRRVRGNTKG